MKAKLLTLLTIWTLGGFAFEITGHAAPETKDGGATKSGVSQGIADRPEKLKFPPLNYEPPNPKDYRVQLKSGPVAYVVPDRELPLVNINISVRTGEYLEPRGKE